MKLNWKKLLNQNRLGETQRESKQEDVRSEYQRDIDRVLFSSAFRRMQDKTQVFPIPKSDFVHNRLTHSIEVSSVGRSLGLLIGKFILQEKETELNSKYTPIDFADIISTACLAHDIGNPPFGHSGEKTISHYFTSKNFSRHKIKADKIIGDLKKFEGNAAGFRIISNDHPSGIGGGLRLTYATLGAFTKYPWESSAIADEKKMNKYCKKNKFGFFNTEKEVFKTIAKELGLIEISSSPLIYSRHPLSFVMEAADTICYRIIDIEDACKLSMITFKDAEKLLLQIIKSNLKHSDYDEKKYESIKEHNGGEAIGYLRAKSIHCLIYEAFEVFKKQYPKIMEGKFNSEIMDSAKSNQTLSEIKKLIEDNVFNNGSVIQIELAGFEVMSGLMDTFIEACQNPELTKSKKLIGLLPKQFKNPELKSTKQLLLIAEFVSRMTDSYAIDFYKKIKGITLPEIG